LLSEEIDELGLVIPEVVMARAAAHEEVDHPLRPWRVMSPRPRIGARGDEISAEKARERRRADAERRATEELSPRDGEIVLRFRLLGCECRVDESVPCRDRVRSHGESAAVASHRMSLESLAPARGVGLVNREGGRDRLRAP